MGGWLILSGPGANEDRLARFRRVFSVPGVPELNVQIYMHAAEVLCVGWAWNSHEIPDVDFVHHEAGSLMLCGAVTSLGRYGEVSPGVPVAGRVYELWREHGRKVLEELNGSFSLAIAEPDGKLTLAVDRFASRSVWYYRDGTHDLVGNFPAAIASCCATRPALDLAGLWSMLDVGRPVANRGLFSGMRSLLGGQLVDISRTAAPETFKWYERRYRPDEGLTASQAGEMIANTLQQSARRYARLCEHPHLFLSGGMDSRLVAAAFPAELSAVTLCTNPNFESKIAARIAAKLGIDHQIKQRSPYCNLETMDAAALTSGGNYLLGHCHFSIPIVQTIATQPGAEFLLGDMLENFNKHYFSADTAAIDNLTGAQIPDFLAANVSQTQKKSARRGMFLRKEIRHKARDEYARVIGELFDSLYSTSDQMADRLDCLLRWEAVSMTYTFNMLLNIRTLGRERNIYFDNDVDDLSLAIPSRLRSTQALHVSALKRMPGRLHRIPDANSFLPPGVPKAIKSAAQRIRPILGATRRMIRRNTASGPVLTTSGSWLLTYEMYRNDERYRRFIENILDDGRLFQPDIFDHQAIRSCWRQYLAGNRALHFEVEGLLTLGLLQKQINLTAA